MPSSTTILSQVTFFTTQGIDPHVAIIKSVIYSCNCTTFFACGCNCRDKWQSALRGVMKLTELQSAFSCVLCCCFSCVVLPRRAQLSEIEVRALLERWGWISYKDFSWIHGWIVARHCVTIQGFYGIMSNWLVQGSVVRGGVRESEEKATNGDNWIEKLR